MDVRNSLHCGYNMSLKIKLLLVFLVISIIPLCFVNFMIFNNYKSAIESSRISELQDIAIYKAEKIENFLESMRKFLEITQESYLIKDSIPVLNRLLSKPDEEQLATIRNNLDTPMRKMQSVIGLSDIMLLNAEGKIIYSSNLENQRWNSGESLPALYGEHNSDRKKTIHFSDIFISKLSRDKPGMLISAPIFDSERNFIGEVVFNIDFEVIHQLLMQETALGRSGEILLVKKEGETIVYLNSLKFDPSGIFNKKIKTGDETGVPAQKAAGGIKGAGTSIDYRGEKVIAAWRYIPATDWGIVVKIDEVEPFADVAKQERSTFIIMLIVFLLAGGMAFIVARSISNPIRKLSEGVKVIGGGNLDYKVGITGKDEIGQLSREFDKMTMNLKRITAFRDFEKKLFHEILDSLPAYVLLLSKDYHVPFANRYFTLRFGESSGRRCFEYLFNRSEPCENCETFNVLKTNTKHRWEWVGPDGRNYDIYDFPFADYDGSSMILEMGIDITEIKSASSELQKYREHLEELVKERTLQLETANENIKKNMQTLEAANSELTRFNRVMVGREMRMVELKKQISALRQELQIVKH